MKTLARAALLLALTMVAGAALAQGALVTDVAGTAQVEGAGKLALLAELPTGRILKLEAGARATLLFLDGGAQFAVSGPGRYEISRNGLETRAGAMPQRRGLPLGPVAAPRLKSAGVSQATLVMRGLPTLPQAQALEPKDTWILDAAQPFAWSAVEGASGYRFVLRDGLENTVYSAETAATSLHLPDSVALESGAAYAWSIEALPPQRRGRPSTASFQVMEPDRREALRALRPAANAPFADRVTYALMLENSGATQAAGRLWSELAAQRPQEPGLAARAAH